jgi:hypothetical protein
MNALNPRLSSRVGSLLRSCAGRRELSMACESGLARLQAILSRATRLVQ